jgi:hypothetical protein
MSTCLSSWKMRLINSGKFMESVVVVLMMRIVRPKILSTCNMQLVDNTPQYRWPREEEKHRRAGESLCEKCQTVEILRVRPLWKILSIVPQELVPKTPRLPLSVKPLKA